MSLSCRKRPSKSMVSILAQGKCYVSEKSNPQYLVQYIVVT